MTGDRTWKVRELTGLVDELLGSGFVDVGARAVLRAELLGEVEQLVRQVYAAMDESERRKYYCARFAYRHRDELTPGTRKDSNGKPIGPVTWDLWFGQIFNDELGRYMLECKERDTLKAVYEYELATFGRSALDLDIQRREQRKAVAA